jgi:hypothetical protein
MGLLSLKKNRPSRQIIVGQAVSKKNDLIMAEGQIPEECKRLKKAEHGSHDL